MLVVIVCTKDIDPTAFADLFASTRTTSDHENGMTTARQRASKHNSCKLPREVCRQSASYISWGASVTRIRPTIRRWLFCSKYAANSSGSKTTPGLTKAIAFT